MSKHAVAVTVSLAALAAAQTLSTACTNGIASLQTNDAANKCLALNQFNNIFLTPSGQSIVTPVNNWLTAMCAADLCSDATIDTVVQTVFTACATDLSPITAGEITADVIKPYIKQYYPTAKQVLCLANTTADAFCDIQLATSIETAIGTKLSLGELVGTIATFLSGGSTAIPPALACNDCTKGVVSVLRQNTQLSSLINVNSVGASVCGADFAASATSMPANIVIGTGAAVPKGSGGKGGHDGAATLAVAGTLSALAGGLVVMFLA